MIFLLGSVGILLGMLPLVVGYFQFGLPQVAVGCLAVGLLWLGLQQYHWDWLPAVGLFVFVCLAGAGAWLGFSPLWMALSVLGSLSAWDLVHFSVRLHACAFGDDLRQVKTSHLVQLGLLDGISLVLILGVQLIRQHITFGWMFLLALVAILGVVQLVKRLTR